MTEKMKYFLDYLKYEKRYSEHTLISYENDLGQFLSYLEESYELDSVLAVKHIHVRSWMVFLMENDITPKSICRKISALRSFFNYCKKKKYITKSPMLKIIAPKIGKRLPAFIQENRIEHLLKHPEEESDFAAIRNRLIILLLYNTGMRRSELINLKPSDINLQRREVSIIGKGNKQRLVPITDELIQEIESYNNIKTATFSGETDIYLLVTNKGKKMYPKAVYNIVKKYLGSVTSLEKRSPHILRHTFATHLSNNGAELNAIKELLGHANLSATQIYTHNSIERLKDVYQKAHPKGERS